MKLANLYHVSTDYLLGSEYNNCIDVTGLDQEDIDVVSGLVRHLMQKENVKNTVDSDCKDANKIYIGDD